jgi:hypothetical protein
VWRRHPLPKAQATRLANAAKVEKVSRTVRTVLLSEAVTVKAASKSTKDGKHGAAKSGADVDGEVEIATPAGDDGQPSKPAVADSLAAKPCRMFLFFLLVPILT